MRPRVIALFCLFCFAAAAQPQQQSPRGTVRNDRTTTIPQTSTPVTAKGQNELVGCVTKTGQTLTLTQPRENRTYQLRGAPAQLENSVGKTVKVTGRLVLGESAFEVHQIESLQAKCESASSASAIPVTGKTGIHGTEQNVTSTATGERVTPGVQTEHGVMQNPSKTERPERKGANPNPPVVPTQSQAAPPNPNVQSPDEAQRNANAAQQAELNNPQAKLGVNAQPNYSNRGNPRANEQAVANQAQQNRGQASGSERVLKGGQAQASSKAPAGQSQGTAPVFSGCLTQDGKDFWLTEQGSGERIRVDGDASKLKDHLNHSVQVVGNKTGTYGPAVGASGGTATVHVQAIQDLAPTCGK